MKFRNLNSVTHKGLEEDLAPYSIQVGHVFIDSLAWEHTAPMIGLSAEA